MQPIAVIQIALLENGAITVQFRAPQEDQRNLFNMLMERAKQDLVPKLMEKENQRIVLPEPDLSSVLAG